MSSMSKELVFLILQFLEEEKFKEALHKLEQDSGVFFNMTYFEEKVQAGEWDEVEKYLSGFTKLEDNRFSLKIFFEIRKQKYLEALDKQDKAKAVEILVGDLKVFSAFNEELYKEITQLLTLSNFRGNEQLSKYGDTKTARSIMFIELKKLIEANPIFHEKLVFPTLEASRLRTLINQSLNWQHQLCKNPKPNPDIKTLFIDHTCTSANGALAPAPVHIPAVAVAKPTAYSSLGGYSLQPFPPAASTANANALSGWMANAAASSSVQGAVVTASSLPVPPNQVSILKRPITPSDTLNMADYQTADHEQLMKQLWLAQPIEKNGIDSMARSLEKTRILDDAIDKSKPWQLTEFVDPGQCRQVTMPESTTAAHKVARLLYTNSGVGLLALGSSGVQKLWKWGRSEQNPSGKATANVVPQQWQPNSGLLMANDVLGVNIDEAAPCIALSKNDSYVMSACGGKVSLFNMMTFKAMATFMPPPPASTFLEFHPQDNNIMAIGMEDSTIHIYNVRLNEVKSKLKGHQKRITGLAFSTILNILVSSGADAQLCVWSIDTWEKKKFVPIQLPANKSPSGDTRVQFHSDQIRLLVSHETQLAIYDASKMDCIHQWFPQNALSAPISYAAFSCNSQLVYASFCDGNIGILDSDGLRLRCRISPSVYLSKAVLSGNQAVYPLAVAAHPQEPNQFAIGLIDGSVKVLEPLVSEAKWGVSPTVDNMLSGRVGSSS
ncbi:protein TPR1-like isoform X2 [Impatiens glandulifera]|uniref:protein TPR1-like isoform X2 n=1 Tax=Impatiens glandulifera TaxID=253017 RepID=UPI001FB12C46|nr:protein TPR1-like isoform X2 [Impatiens glandulifera]